MKQFLLLLLPGMFVIPSIYAQVDSLNALQDKTISTAPVVSISSSDLDEESSPNISGLLQSSQDIFTSTAGYGFGPSGFNIRGMDSENSTVMINGVPLNDMESGRVFYSSWGGLNDVLRNDENNFGMVPSKYHIGTIGGITNINTRASSYSKQTKFVYSLSNRTYRNRLMATYSTGLMKNKWAITASASRRWSEEGFIEATFYDAWSYFVSVEKLFNNKHSLGLVVFGAPTKRGKSGVTVQEARDLAGTNFYNPYWGYQNGEKRNAYVADYHQPMLIFSHYFTLNAKTRITSSLSYTFGKGANTALDWYDAADPRPDYYRKLPSFYEEEDNQVYDDYLNWWLNDETFRQINFDFMYFANRKNLYTMTRVDGVEGNNYTGNLSKYIIEERRNDKSQIKFNPVMTYEISDHLTLSSGLDLTWYKGFNYKIVNDLLGGDFYLNVDKYAEREFIDLSASQNDLTHPNQIIRTGDRFGYDYTANINNYLAFAIGKFKYNKIDFFLAGSVGYNEFWRTGNMKNGKFPENSYGDSEKQSFILPGIKAGATYKITGRHFIDVNAAAITRAPYFRNSYISVRTRDDVSPVLENEKIYSGDVSYIIRSPYIRSRLTGYVCRYEDQLYERMLYHEFYNTFVSYLMTGVDKLHYGVELGLDVKVHQTVSLHAVAAAGNFNYDSRPSIYISRDNDAELLTSDRIAYLKNFKVGGMPETALNFGIKYESPQYWFIGADINYFDDIYLEPNPDRRTAESTAGMVNEDVPWQKLITQEEMPDAFTVDAYAGKSWRIKNNYIGININMSNILDNQDFITGGFEQFRLEPKDVDKFPAKHFYSFGRTYFINLSYRF